MIKLLILMYILEANGAIIPFGCYLAAWILVLIRSIAAVAEHLTKQ